MANRTSLRKKFTVILLIFVAISLISTIMIYHSVSNIKYNAHVINLSGSQRMLTQRISKDAADMIVFKNSNHTAYMRAKLTADEKLFDKKAAGKTAFS